MFKARVNFLSWKLVRGCLEVHFISWEPCRSQNVALHQAMRMDAPQIPWLATPFPNATARWRWSQAEWVPIFCGASYTLLQWMIAVWLVEDPVFSLLTCNIYELKSTHHLLPSMFSLICKHSPHTSRIVWACLSTRSISCTPCQIWPICPNAAIKKPRRKSQWSDWSLKSHVWTHPPHSVDCWLNTQYVAANKWTQGKSTDLTRPLQEILEREWLIHCIWVGSACYFTVSTDFPSHDVQPKKTWDTCGFHICSCHASFVFRNDHLDWQREIDPSLSVHW